jgi:hypothetical protein
VRLRIRDDPGQGATRRGGCACGAIRYELTDDPIIVHACHCLDCYVHLFTRSKAPWLALPTDVPAFATFYRIPAVWSPLQLARWRRARTAR